MRTSNNISKIQKNLFLYLKKIIHLLKQKKFDLNYLEFDLNYLEKENKNSNTSDDNSDNNFIKKITEAIVLNYAYMEKFQYSLVRMWLYFIENLFFPEKIDYYPCSLIIEIKNNIEKNNKKTEEETNKESFLLNEIYNNQKITLEKNQEIIIKNDDEEFTFSNCFKTEIIPLIIDDQIIARKNNENTINLKIRLCSNLNQNNKLKINNDKLNNHDKIEENSYEIKKITFFISSKINKKSYIYQKLNKNINYIEITLKNKNIKYKIDKKNLKFKGFKKNETFLFKGNNEHNGIHILYDYFNFENKFYFFDLILDNVLILNKTEHINIEFFFDEINLKNESHIFSINTISCINLSCKNLQPFIIEKSKNYYKINKNENKEILKINFINILLKNNFFYKSYPLFYNNKIKINFINTSFSEKNKNNIYFINEKKTNIDCAICIPNAIISENNSPLISLEKSKKNSDLTNIILTSKNSKINKKSNEFILIKTHKINPMTLNKKNKTSFKNIDKHLKINTDVLNNPLEFLKHYIKASCFDLILQTSIIYAMKDYKLELKLKNSSKSPFIHCIQRYYLLTISIKENELPEIDLFLFEKVLQQFFKYWSPIDTPIYVNFITF